MLSLLKAYAEIGYWLNINKPAIPILLVYSSKNLTGLWNIYSFALKNVNTISEFYITNQDMFWTYNQNKIIRSFIDNLQDMSKSSIVITKLVFFLI